MNSNKPEPVTRLPSEMGAGSLNEESLDPSTEAQSRSPSQENTVVDATENSERASGMKARQPSKASEPFEQWERDEMERLLTQLNGHLGEFDNHVVSHGLTRPSFVSYKVLGRRRYGKQFSVQCR